MAEDQQPVASSPELSPPPPGWVRVRGARVHNLKHVDVDIPRERLTVITGPSGSGKTSLAFDTLYAEGQRKLVESLSIRARQAFDLLAKPDCDSVSGLPATLAVTASGQSAGPRATVATTTELHDLFRLLFARVGQAHCPVCGQPLLHHARAQIVDAVTALPPGSRVLVLAVLHGTHTEPARGDAASAVERAREAGLLRVRIHDDVFELADVPKFAARKAYRVEAVVDRILLKDDSAARVSESVELAARLGEGLVAVAHQPPGADAESVYINMPFSTRFACPAHGVQAERMEPGLFSFNSPAGACPTCHGLGVDPEYADRFGRFRHAPPCKTCGGARLGAVALAVRVAGKSIDDIARMSVTEAQAFFAGLQRPDQTQPAATVNERPGHAPSRTEPEPSPATARSEIATPILREINARLGFIADIGLGYLTLARSSMTLSGGEVQRLRLATQIGSGLIGVMYVLDEPTSGLHPIDTHRLIDALQRLRDQGNTLVLVEHDQQVIRHSDWLIDMGPGAGREGGAVLVQGPTAATLADPRSITGRYLNRSGEERSARTGTGYAIELSGCKLNNLRDLTVRFPLGTLTAVTGVSGSGKSSLVFGTLLPALRNAVSRTQVSAGPHRKLVGADQVSRVADVEQPAGGRSPRSTPATITDLLDPICDVFAATREAKLRGYGPSRFRYNSEEGRCETCGGLGVKRIDMQFLPDLFLPCETCAGQRYNRATLQVTYRGKSIADVLAMTAGEARLFFDAHPKIAALLQAMLDVGLSYLPLGQAAPTLSGGEHQRLRLASELAKPASGTVFILDEPTSGLHASDVDRLLHMLHRLVDGDPTSGAAGGTVIVVEHNPAVIAAADWIIELGPGAGADGGQLVAEGTPGELSNMTKSLTAKRLAHERR